MKKKRIPMDGRFRIFPADLNPATDHEGCTLDRAIAEGRVHVRRHRFSGRLKLHFAAPFDDLSA